MNLLFQIKRSPYISRDLEHILPVAKEGSHIFLYQDAVLAARGIRRALDGVDIIDYSGWVDLVERFQPVSC